MRIELSEGGWADIADDLDHLTNAQRHELLYRMDETEGGSARKAIAMNLLAVAYAVTAWSLDLDLPAKDPSVLERISARDGAILEDAVWELKYTAAPLDTSRPPPDDPPDPQAPTGPSRRTATPVRAARSTSASRSRRTSLATTPSTANGAAAGE